MYIYIYNYIYLQTDVLLYRKPDVTFQPCVEVMQFSGNLEETHPTFALGVVGNDTSTESTCKAETSFL